MRYLLYFCFLLLLCGCGTEVKEFSLPTLQTATESTEFEQWKAEVRQKTPEEFVQWWNSEGKEGWNFSYCPPEYNSLEEVFEKKIITCHWMTLLLREIYNGQYVYIYWENCNQSHAVLLLQNGFISFCGLEASFISLIKIEDIRRYFQADTVEIIH